MTKSLRPPLKPIIFLVCLWPLFSIGYTIYNDNLGANPIEYIEKHFGLWALIFLCLTLSLTPLKRLTQFGQWILYRRMLGLFVFFYASVHLLIYLGLDYQFSWPLNILVLTLWANKPLPISLSVACDHLG